MNCVYPAIFTHNDDGSYTIIFPDLPGCVSEGKNLSNALYMANSALTQWIEYLVDEQGELPAPSDYKKLQPSVNQFTNLIRAEIRDNHAVRRTVSIPAWMDAKASAAGISLSKILQEALTARL
ncbi:MAG: type II toxin-antitoxin system HicB family antitoxin [Syntrophomonadaceae bacterium]|jgi:predicted RNase H-like HicB family nuclease|nr:type II toxin-antitoxin system HicB family antitoxin [Syntrophomonadaceae bacterium]